FQALSRSLAPRRRQADQPDFRVRSGQAVMADQVLPELKTGNESLSQMFRISLTAGIVSLASFLCVQGVQAQSVGDWTLNINNRHGAAIIPAGGTLPYDVRITNDGNYDTPAGRLDFTIPATTIYRGV